MFSNATDKKITALEKSPQDAAQLLPNNKKTVSKLALANVSLGAGLVAYYLVFNQFNNAQTKTALVELGCNAASAFVDVKPSTLNTIVGLGNVIWGGVKLVAVMTGTLAVGSTGNIIVPCTYFASTIILNSINAGYRLWYAKKNTDPVKNQ